MKHLTILILFVTACAWSACKKEDKPGDVNNIPGLGGDKWAQTPIDVWIKDSLTTSLNVAVKYKWDQGELDFSKALVPPKEEKIIPVLSTVRATWIKPYEAEKGELFMRMYCPKHFVLVGSPSFNLDGTITLGTAEGGRKVVLYVLNEFRTKLMPGYQPRDSFNVKQMFHTIHHEFGHILNQNILYPASFKRITVELYTPNWNNISDEQALTEGFITAYAISSPDEDFVEMVSIMLIEGKDGFERIVNSIVADGYNGATPDVAKARLRQKEAAVVKYFDDAFDIDFYSLQRRTRAAIEAIIK